MKLALVVADGVHKGKIIPITVPQFLIGREPHCQLRPASQAISKQHCAILIRDGKVFIKDFGSTNGTFVNTVRVEGELEIKDADALQVGPLAFTVKLEVSVPAAAPSNAPAAKPAAAPAAVVAKPGSNPNIKKPAAPAPAAKPQPKPASVTETESTAALDSDVDLTAKSKGDAADGPGSDRFAAMLLGLEDDDTTSGGSEPSIPEGTTVMEMPALEGDANKKADAKASPASEKQANSNVAADILKKYMRRPRS